MYLYLLGGYLIVFLKLMNFSCIVWIGIYRYLYLMSYIVLIFGVGWYYGK